MLGHVENQKILTFAPPGTIEGLCHGIDIAKVGGAIYRDLSEIAMSGNGGKEGEEGREGKDNMVKHSW
jgi:hypothetical protein